MIVMFSARRLKPGAWSSFAGPGTPARTSRPASSGPTAHETSATEDEVISFRLFDMTEDQYRAWRESVDAEENQRIDRLSAFVKNDHVSGVYEVIDTVDS